MLRGVPLVYVLRNLWARRTTTLLTAGGMALVVFVFASVLMLSRGIETTLVATGRDDNVIVIRRSAETEVQSNVERSQGSIAAATPGIAVDVEGRPLVSRETVILVSLTKRSTGRAANVTLRGVGPQGLALRPQVRLVEGRAFRPGSAEIIAGRKMAEKFRGAGLGESIRFGLREWTVVGVFDASPTAFNSEIWGDAEQFMQAYRRPTWSNVVFRLADPREFPAVQARLESDPRLTVDVERETEFYAKQSEALATFLRVLGLVLSVIFSIGATIGAMITMYASVAARVAEIGTLRAIGFRRGAILVAFLGEALALGFVGGVLGLFLASFMQSITVSTLNFQTFSEIAFRFTLTPDIAVQSIVFALGMGFVGGFLPAAHAARMDILDALRAV